MDRKGTVRRATSAGYRLPERPSVALASQSSVSVVRPLPGRARSNEPPERDIDTRDPVKQDQVWREFVHAEQTGSAESDSNFPGRPRAEPPLPSYVPLYSDTVPNTTNQTFGSRVCTELGKELMRIDKLLILTASHRKTKRSPEMQPC
uniref:Uncharacterized protein n=1 Tax=Pygocentrus nattereri TaxID=42514 RepID=A0AAR2IHC8_PYGNA